MKYRVQTALVEIEADTPVEAKLKFVYMLQDVALDRQAKDLYVIVEEVNSEPTATNPLAGVHEFPW